MERYICIHGHFYQPPRENPWLESIEIQDSAAPFHDWNERITSECYGPNATARILNGEQQIDKIVNNYAKINFNFGATLLSWIEIKYPGIYRAILDADRESLQNYAGHGSAIAQVYNHIIMPLANQRDKVAQVKWGVQDFVHRFGRYPEGMWLAETAVDIDTLETLAAENIRYTILAPHQVQRFRATSGGAWQDVSAAGIDTRRAYLVNLPSGKTISLFFYNGELSRAVAFEKLLHDGAYFAQRLTEAVSLDDGGLSHIATDGETYGHHHRYGDMALAYALDHIEKKELATLINYGAFLDKYPPRFEVEITENSSWSCAHGIERWRANCGCNSGGHDDWSQSWRAPLRSALDWLRDQVSRHYEEYAQSLLKEPEMARNDYINVILDRSHQNVASFLEKHQSHPLSVQEQNDTLKLLEIQRNAMLMYTSCGWFFDELSGIETVQILQYAGRVIQLFESFPNTKKIEEDFLTQLEQAKSNLPERKDGKAIYNKYVRPAFVDFPKLAAHYAATSLFFERKERKHLYAYTVEERNHTLLEAGRAKLALGQLEVRSNITWGHSVLSFGILHLGDHNLRGGVRTLQEAKQEIDRSQEQYRDVKKAFLRADIPEVLLLLDQHFSELTYSIQTLFRDQQRDILDQMLSETMQDTQTMARKIYRQHAPLLRYLTHLEYPIPDTIRNSISFVINAQLRDAFQTQPLPLEQIDILLEEAKDMGSHLDQKGLQFILQQELERLAENWKTEREPDKQAILFKRLVEMTSLLSKIPFEINLYRVQNIFYKKSKQSFYLEQVSQDREKFRNLGRLLHIAI